MAFGCFSWKGCGGLEFIKPNEMMNGIHFKQVLGGQAGVVHDRMPQVKAGH
jgi:hypothetical protein